MRPILLGMNDPNFSGDPEKALEPWPKNGAGWRLWQVSGMTEEVYRASFERMNLVNQRHWSRRAAAIGAREFLLRMALLDEQPPVVALGRQVEEALRSSYFVLPRRVFFLPHPSGRCHWYNDQANRARARRLLRRLAR